MIKRKHMFALGSTLLLGAAGFASAETSDVEAMKAEMAAMKSEIATLKGQSNDNWLNERRAEEVKALVRDVLSDADTRASLMAAGATAGHDGKRFFLASEDGNFRLNVGGQVQIRYEMNWNHASTGSKGAGAPDNFDGGFELRRIKLQFDGHIGSPKFGYKVVLAADRNSGSISAEEAVVDYKITDNVTIYGGRTKAPFLREELVSSRRQLAVERSLVNELFTTGFVEGAGFVWSGLFDDKVRLNGMINDGTNSGEVNAGPAKRFEADVVDLAATGRVDVKLMGDWAAAEEFAAWSGDPQALILGAAIHYEHGESGQHSGGAFDSNNFLMWTVDALFKTGGFNLYGAAIGRHNTKTEGGGVSTSDYGFLVQGGYMVIPDKLEPFLRYEYALVDDDAGNHDIQIVTVGANYYILRHAAKFTADVVIPLSNISGSIGNGIPSNGGIFNDDSGVVDQYAVRLQFQLLF